VAFHAGEGRPGLRRLLWTRGRLFDLLFVSRPVPLQALQETLDIRSPRPTTPIIYDAEAVVTPREARRLALLGHTMSEGEYQSALDQELRGAQRADLVTTVSRADADVIASKLNIPVMVVPHPVQVTSGGPDFERRRDFLFVGRLTGSAVSSPNVDSIIWFVREIMPILDVILGQRYVLHVVGRVDAPELDAVQNDRILFHGVVEELKPLYDQCRVFIAPTRFAAGIPLKVVEAMGRGIPCVVTPLLAEQLAAGHALLTGGSPREFAQACTRLYTDAPTWNDVRQDGLAHVQRHYSDEVFEHALALAIDRVLGPHHVGHPKPPSPRP
jgi:glycosyltransferase involved in cell wall biosynthesis